MSDANSLLNNAFGQRQISTIYQPLNQYKVVMEVAPRYTQDVSALDKMFVINSDGKAIPLSYFAQLAAGQRAAVGEPSGAVRGLDHLLQPARRFGTAWARPATPSTAR